MGGSRPPPPLPAGVVVEPEVAAALGMALPGAEEVERVRAELRERMMAAMQEEQEQEQAAAAAAAASSGDEQPQKRAWGASFGRRRQAPPS